MTLDELLAQLRIDKEPVENDNGSYTIDLMDSNEYAKYYSRLDKSDLLFLDDEASQGDVDTSSLQYLTDEEDFVITLLANFESEEYKIIIREL